jgi:hypothetical protein
MSKNIELIFHFLRKQLYKSNTSKKPRWRKIKERKVVVEKEVDSDSEMIVENEVESFIYILNSQFIFIVIRCVHRSTIILLYYFKVNVIL